MKKRNGFILAAVVLIAALSFMGCPTEPDEETISDYTVTVSSTPNGTITATPQYGPVDTQITLTVSPESGFILKSGTLKYKNVGGTGDGTLITGNAFSMPASHVTVTAEFEAVASGQYTVSTPPLAFGTITANPQSGPADTPIALTIHPEDGYRLKAGTLKYNAQLIEGTTFVLPAANVTVTAEFEKIPAASYSVTIGVLPHGTITANPQNGPVNTSITLTITPDDGYILTTGSLKYKNADGTGVETAINGTTFSLPAANVTVTAEFEKIPDNNYQVKIAPLLHGKITANPQYGPENTPITLAITPDSGYGLKDGTLKYKKADGAETAITGNTFNLPGYNVTVSAEFEEKAAAYLVAQGIQSLTEANFDAAITAFDAAYTQDKTNNAAIIYSSLGKLASIVKDQKVRDLMQNHLGLTGYPDTIGVLFTEDWMDTYTNEELNYWYYDEASRQDVYWRDKDYEWDQSFFKWYELTPVSGYYAYEQLPYDQPKYFLQGTEKKYGKLEWIQVADDDGFTIIIQWYDYSPINGNSAESGYYYYSYSDGYQFVQSEPVEGDLDRYLDPDWGAWIIWYETKPSNYGEGTFEPGYYKQLDSTYTLVSTTGIYDTWTERNPGLSLPEWFEKTEVYKENLTSAGLKSGSTWPLLFMANIITRNSDGLNGFLDNVLSSVFGATFEEAVSRASGLTYADSILVDETIIDALGYTELLEGKKIYVGKAELDLIFSLMRIFRGSLEWVTAYDWNTDLTFLQTEWKDLEENIANLKPKDLPFGNNFMKDRKNGMMDKSKADLIKALEDSIAAYTYYIGNDGQLPQGAKDTLIKYEWIKDGAGKLRSAINSGGNFYLQKNLDQLSGSNYDNTATNALIGINMRKFFTPGQFAIDKLITTEAGGKSPQFYGFKNDSGSESDASAALSGTPAWTDYGAIGFRLILAPVREVIILGTDDFLPKGTTYDLPIFPVSVGKDFYGLYHISKK
jgi:hypothetical protein